MRMFITKLNSKDEKIFLSILLTLLFVTGEIILPAQYGFILILIIYLINRHKNFSVGLNKNDIIILPWFYLYYLLMVVSLTYVNDISLTVSYSNYFLVGLLLYSVIRCKFNSLERIIVFMYTFIFCVCIVSVFTLISHLNLWATGSTSIFLSVSNRGVGLYGNPNYYSTSLLLSISFILCLYYLKQLNTTRIKLYMNIAFIIISIDLILTFSRGALLAFLAVIVTFFISRIRYNLTWKRLILLLFPSLFLIFLVMNSEVPSFLEEFVTDRLYDRLTETTGSGRTVLWGSGWDLFTSNYTYMLFGTGGNQFAEHPGMVNTVHNNYLRFLYETGIFGFLLLLALLIYLLCKTFSLRTFKIKSPFFFPFIGFLVYSLTNDMFMIKEFWLLVSIILVWDVQSKKNES